MDIPIKVNIPHKMAVDLVWDWYHLPEHMQLPGCSVEQQFALLLGVPVVKSTYPNGSLYCQDLYSVYYALFYDAIDAVMFQLKLSM
jgi:hypothetical protein